MGLDNNISKYSKRIALDVSMIDRLNQANLCLSCFTGSSFRGKSYVAIIDILCNESLYGLLCPFTLREMANQLEDFIETHLENTEGDEEDGDIDVRHYIADYNDSYDEDRYIVTKKELISLKTLFRLCAENNLYIHPDY
jgi:hypothetical protein